MEYVDKNVSHELSQYGFTGQLLLNLLEIIVDEKTLQDFYNFILLWGEDMSKVMLVHNFKLHVREKQSFYKKCDDFVKDLEGSKTIAEKHVILKRLFYDDCNQNKLNKVLEWIDEGKISAEQMYELIVDYRKGFDCGEIITLIDSLHL